MGRDNEVSVMCERVNGKKALVVFKKDVKDHNFPPNIQKQLLESKNCEF